MNAATEFTKGNSIAKAPLCAALAIPRATLYRRLDPKVTVERPRPTPARALRPEERQSVLAVLHSDRFVDKAPTEVYATLLDERKYLCSVRTMYRILAANKEVRERRDQLRHPAYAKPELLATSPNELWSWDITKLLGPEKWTYYYLYVMLDVYSRYVVGWMVANRESGTLAKRFIKETLQKQMIEPNQLTIHADRGTSMRSKPVALLMADLGVTKTHSRPYTSTDNPFSEAHFKTMKYRPEFPERFGCLEDARLFCRTFFAWYNDEHRHSGLALLTPSDIHHGRTDTVLNVRQKALLKAYEAKPERFVHGPPRVAHPPQEVWINNPALAASHQKPTEQSQEEVLH